MPKPLPHLCLATGLLRKVMGLTEAQLAERVGCTPNAISDFERRQRELSRERAEALVAAMGLGPPAIEEALRFIDTILAMARRGSLLSEAPEGGHELVTGLAERLGQALTAAAEPVIDVLLSGLLSTLDRQEAAYAWDRLKRKSREDRLVLVRKSREYRSWGLCELVCAESLKAAPDSAKRALELAELAVEMAQLCREQHLQPRVEGYARVHLGHAQRVHGQLRVAEASFAKALPLWEAGAANDPGLLSEARVLGLYASLRLAQRRPKEALALLEEAMASDQGGELKPHLLLNRAKSLELLDRYEDAITVLQDAAPLVALDDDRRLRWVLQFSLTANLCHLGRFEEAAALLPRVRALAVEQNNGLDLLRTRGLDGWVAGGLGDLQRAAGILESVRDDFVVREMAFDTALVTLDLAVLYLEEARTSEVKTVAAQLAWVFETEGVHPEALAALALFCEAARRETLTLELTRKLREYLFRARENPDLKFEGSPC